MGQACDKKSGHFIGLRSNDEVHNNSGAVQKEVSRGVHVLLGALPPIASQVGEWQRDRAARDWAPKPSSAQKPLTART
jgi:hypothetical protein